MSIGSSSSTFFSSVLLILSTLTSPFLPMMMGSLVSLVRVILPLVTLHSSALGQPVVLVCQPSTTTTECSGMSTSTSSVMSFSSVLLPVLMCARCAPFCFSCTCSCATGIVDSCLVSMIVCFLLCSMMVPFTKSCVTPFSLMKVVPPTKSVWRLCTTSARNRTSQSFL